MNEQERSELELLKQRQARLAQELGSLSTQLAALETRLTRTASREPQIAISSSTLPKEQLNLSESTPVSQKPATPKPVPIPDPTPIPIPPVIGPTQVVAQSAINVAPKPPATPEIPKPKAFPVLEQVQPKAEVPPVPPSLPHREPVAPAPKHSFEMRLGTFWLVRIGIVMLLTGLIFFGNYAYQNYISNFGPAGKVSLLYLASGLLLGAGAWWQRKAVT
jgi:uncharacterized membrane protein